MGVSLNIVLILTTFISSASLLPTASLYHQKYREEITKLISKDHLSFHQLGELLSLTLIEDKMKRGGRSKTILNESRYVCF